MTRLRWLVSRGVNGVALSVRVLPRDDMTMCTSNLYEANHANRQRAWHAIAPVAQCEWSVRSSPADKEIDERETQVGIGSCDTCSGGGCAGGMRFGACAYVNAAAYGHAGPNAYAYAHTGADANPGADCHADSNANGTARGYRAS